MQTIDFHTHIGHSIYGYGQTLEQLLENMQRCDIAKAVVCPVQPVDYHLPPENDRVAMAANQDPERLIGFARIDPRRPDAITELERCVQDLGLSGLFVHPWEENCPANSSQTKALCAEALKLKIPVMIAGGHVRVSMPSQVADLARSLPELTIIVTSGGQINISGIMLSEARRMLVECPNTILETSGIYREDFIEDLVPVVGSKRMVFGSNSPQYALELEVLRPRLSHLDPADQANLLWQSAARILNFA